MKLTVQFRRFAFHSQKGTCYYLFSIFFSVLPDIDLKPRKPTCEVPLKAVEWSLRYLETYLKFKSHEDLDLKVHVRQAVCQEKSLLNTVKPG